jgi:hypothetical protein
MPQQQLHRAQVGAVVEQVRGEGVAQRVRRQRRGDAGHTRVALDDGPEHHARHAGAARGDEQVVGLLRRPRMAPRASAGSAPASRLRLGAERHQALLAALAHHPQHAFVQAQLKGLERDQLAHAQAAGVHQLQHGAVAQAQRRVHVGRVQQRLHLRLAQRLGHAQRLARGQQAQRGVGVTSARAAPSGSSA